MSERQGSKNRHQATRRLIQLRQLADFVVELGLLLADLLMDRQERCDHTEELMIFAQKLADLIAKLQADRAWEQQTIFFDQTADLVLDISTNGHEPGSRAEYRADPLTFLALDFDLSIP